MAADLRQDSALSRLNFARRLSLAAVIVIAPARHLRAQSDQPLTLSVARDAAQRNSPIITVAREAVTVARARERQAGALANPTLSYGREQTSGADQANAQDIASLDQPIDLGLRSLRRDAARARREAAEARLALAQAEVDHDVTVAYARAVAADQRARIAEQAAGAFTRAVRVSEQRLAAGDVAGYAHRRLRLEAARTATARAEAALAALSARVALKSLIAGPELSISASGLVLSDSPTPPAEAPAADSSVALAARFRAELHAVARDAEAAAADARLVARERIPVPVVSAGLKSERVEQPGAGAQSLGGFIVGVSLPLPLFDRRGGATQAAEAEARRQLALLGDQRRRVAQEVLEAHAAYAAAREQLMLLGPAVNADAGAAIAAADVACAEGEITLAEWLDVLRAYREAQASYATLQAEILIRRAALERAVGAPLTTLSR